MHRPRHYLSLIVNRPDLDVDDQWIDQARLWFGPAVPLAFADTEITVLLRDDDNRPLEWRMAGWVVESVAAAA